MKRFLMVSLLILILPEVETTRSLGSATRPSKPTIVMIFADDWGRHAGVYAPHTAQEMVGEWEHAYSRDEACFPVGRNEEWKYWCPVKRVDNVYGDRNLFCSCAPVGSSS